MTATGTSLTALTATLTVATLESRPPSFTLKVKLSVPLKFALGAYETVAVQFEPGVPVPLGTLAHVGEPIAPRLPLLGAVTRVKVRFPLSISLALSVTRTGLSSSAGAVPLLATGASFTG